MRHTRRVLVLILCALTLACASSSRGEWRRADGSLDKEQRLKDLTDCQSRYGPAPNAPMSTYSEIRSCMRSKGWVYREASAAK